jgi:hypothetical protein
MEHQAAYSLVSVDLSCYAAFLYRCIRRKSVNWPDKDATLTGPVLTRPMCKPKAKAARLGVIDLHTLSEKLPCPHG